MPSVSNSFKPSVPIAAPKGMPKGGAKRIRNHRVYKPCTSIEVQSEVQSGVQSEVQSESGAFSLQPLSNPIPVQYSTQALSNTLSTQAIKLIIKNCVRQEDPKTMPDHEFNTMVELIFNKIMNNTGSFENGYQGYLSDSRLCEDLVFSLFNANKREIWPYWL